MTKLKQIIGVEEKKNKIDESFDAGNFQVPIELEAYTEGYNTLLNTEMVVDIEKIERWVEEYMSNGASPESIADAIATAIEQGKILKVKEADNEHRV